RKIAFSSFYFGSENPHVLRVRSGSQPKVRLEKLNFWKSPYKKPPYILFNQPTYDEKIYHLDDEHFAVHRFGLLP
ncbi:MAG: hypothetical protein RSF93_07885, partial [Mucinivorans sp.]